MVDIQSKEVIDKISETLKVQPAMQIPRALAKDIQLVYDVNPPVISSFGDSVGKATTTTVTLATAEANRRTFLSSVYMSYMKDSTSDGTSMDVRTTSIDGSTRVLLRIDVLTTVADSGRLSISFPNPIELLPGATVTMIGAFTVGTQTQTGGITGFTIDPQ